MEYLRNKWHGLAVLFRDHELRVLSPLSVIFLVLLVSVKYFTDRTYVFIIAAGSFLLFAYLFQFLILYDAYFLTIGWLRRGIAGEKRHHSLWFLRIITGVLIFIEITFFAILFLPSLGMLFMASLLVWAGIESVLFAKFAWDISEKLRSKGLRAVIYLGISLVYAIYLTLMISTAGSSLTSEINDTLFDWILSLALFFFALANMGQAFAPGLDRESRPLGKRVGWGEVKLRNVVLCVLFLAIGFEFFMRGLPALLPSGATVGDITRGYYLLRAVYFWPCMVGGLIRGLVRKKKQTSGTINN